MNQDHFQEYDAHEEMEITEDENSDQETENVAVKVAALEALLKAKDEIIRKYEEELRNLRAQVSQDEEVEDVSDYVKDEDVQASGDGTPDDEIPTEINETSSNTRRKCLFFERRGSCRFGASCFNVHPSRKCQLFSSGEGCSSGDLCLFLHPKRVCRYWLKGFCRKSSEECRFRHDKSQPNIKGSPIGSDSKLSNPFLDQSIERIISTKINTALNKWSQPHLGQPPWDSMLFPATWKNFQECHPASWKAYQ